MDEPKEVSASGGKARWVASDGRSYATHEEAFEANITFELNNNLPPPAEGGQVGAPESRSKRALGSLAGFAVFGGLAMVGAHGAWNGELQMKEDWHLLVLAFGWFALTGLALQFAADAYTALRGREAEPEAVFNWWMNKVGCGLLTLVAALIALALVWAFASNLFEGVSKGQTMIILLLFGILVVLAGRKESRPR